MSRAAALALVLLVAGCDAALDPVDPAGRHFSMSGVLDASADTQWVRVEPVTPTFDPQPGLTGTEVTLERIVDGRTVRLTETVRDFVTGPAHLFWTAEPVALGETYRLRARGPDGEAHATVEVPDRAPSLTVFGGSQDVVAVAVVRDAPLLVDVLALYSFGAPGVPDGRLSKRSDVVEREDGSYSVGIYPLTDRERLAPNAPVRRCEVLVASGSPQWEGVRGLDRETAAVENQTDRVEGGVGFVGGVATARAPLFVWGCPGPPIEERP